MKIISKILANTIRCVIGTGIVAGMANLPLYGHSIPEFIPRLVENNVTWTTPGPTSAQSMPLGNGDIGLNVWAETNGAVDFYIGKSDAWGDNVEGDEGLIKVGGVRMTITPNPLTSRAPFRQTLMLHKGQIQITEGVGTNSATFLVWVDANNPVIRVEVTSSGTPLTIQASLLDWRLGNSHPGLASSDIISTGQTNYICWYHRNSSSDDPHVANWTTGAIIQGTGMTNTSWTNLTSVPTMHQVISVYPLATRTATTRLWLNQLKSNISQINKSNLETTRANSQAWWDAFWHRSWIFVMGDQSATNTTEGYVLQRFISACAGRGHYPIKFNGSLFVVDNPSLHYTPDGRFWGGRYWFQNTRLIYWPMLESGDFDMMMPFFNMYAQMLPANTIQITNYYGHGGSYFDEVSPFWGGVTYAGPDVPANYHSQYFTGILELSMMMLDYYEYTEDTNFLAKTLLPTVSAGLDFYDQHFGLDRNGKILLSPVNAIETYWKANDPTPDIAGLTAVLRRMLALPDKCISTVERAKWSRMLSTVPPIPTGFRKGHSVILPYAGPQTNQVRNGENPELYTVFPYRLYGLDKPNLLLAISSYKLRRFNGLTSADWTQDGIQAAMLGLPDIAKQYVVYNMTNKDPSLKFPAFWRQMNDYMPSQDTGCIGEDTLQKMIMQTDGKKILLLPAWPAGWNASFKLHAPFNTTVQGTILNGAISNLIVTPSSRRNDIILMNGSGSPPEAPAKLAATAINTQATLHWSISARATSYDIKQAAKKGGPYTVVARGVVSTNYIISGLTNGKSSYYVVSGQNPSGEGNNSNPISIIPTASVPDSPDGLVAITNNTAAAGNKAGDITAEIVLSWKASLGATHYTIKRSTTDGGPYTMITSDITNISYVDTNITLGTTYYYVVTADNIAGMSAYSNQADATPSSSAARKNKNIIFNSGTFTNDAVLSLAGTPKQELYGVNLGGVTPCITANGYTFSGYPDKHISYDSGQTYVGFLSNSSGDAAFDAVLNKGALGLNNGTVVLSNLTVGATYNVLFLEADTRAGVGKRMFSLSSGFLTSPNQSYAFRGGDPSMGGYILCTFLATKRTQTFTNNQRSYGYQLNAILVENTSPVSSIPDK